MQTFLGLILAAGFGVLVRILAQFHLIDFDSLTFLIITPMIMGYIPFLFKDSAYRRNGVIAVFFPLLAVLIYLLLAVVTHLEDLVCFIIIGTPYIVFSVVFSMILYYALRKKATKKPDDRDIIDQLSFPLLFLPLLLGQIEKQFPKSEERHTITSQIDIQLSAEEVWQQLYAIPNLSQANEKSTFNSLGIPQPIKSTYDPKTNVRLGYFDNGIVLHESVKAAEKNRKLVFAIDIAKSNLDASPTLTHILKSGMVKFHAIAYELKPLNSGSVRLRLQANFSMYSNVPAYSRFWSKAVVSDFERNLLRSLKKVLEKNQE